MSGNRYFDLWVAETIFAISGIWPEDLCGLERECALTFSEVRMAACQPGFGSFSGLYKRGNVPRSERVSAHQPSGARILH
jgi:hypothetical protein